MMAKHLNESPYSLSVKALGDGHYMFGNKKIFAKIMNEKLVIKAGGGFMLIDEFIKNYGDEGSGVPQQMTRTGSSYAAGAGGRASPKRAGPYAGAGSPKGSPKRF